MSVKKIAILGTRGIPANHGGFETFVENLAPYLAKEGFDVTVYCQATKGHGSNFNVSEWNGVRLINILSKLRGAWATLEFDWKSIVHAAKERPDVALVFGYNTSILCLLLRFKKIPIILNMDGLEWKRKKWNILFKIWFLGNEKIGCRVASHLIADHPEIQKRLGKFVLPKKITMIPYGADTIKDADPKLVLDLGLELHDYALIIGRPEPENHVLEIVRSFSEKKRGYKLVLLGDYEKDINQYKKDVKKSAGAEVVFLGPLYKKKTVEALLFYCRVYFHGHSVGGTNPALVQAMAADCRILAHDNPFNRGTLGERGAYFNLNDLSEKMNLNQIKTECDLVSKEVRTTIEINECYKRLINLV